MRRRCKAFTLVEMVIVISILSILLAITIPNYLVMSEKAEVDRVAKGIASMIIEMYERIESEMAYYTYFVVINNRLQATNNEKYLEIKLIKLFEEDKRYKVVTLKQLISRRVEIGWIGYKSPEQPFLICITYDNRLNYRIFEPQDENTILLSSFKLINGDTHIEVVSSSLSNIKKKITIKEIPPGSVIIE